MILKAFKYLGKELYDMAAVWAFMALAVVVALQIAKTPAVIPTGPRPDEQTLESTAS